MENIKVTKTQLITSIFFYGANTLFFICSLYNLFYKVHTINYLTNLSYYANSIFLLICLFCDILLYMMNNSENEKNYMLMEEPNINNTNNNYLFVERLNNWNRNKYGIICNTFSFFVTVNFWILFLLGEEYIRISNSFNGRLRTIYLHLIISILVIIDYFIAKRKHKFSWTYFTIILFIFALYCILLIINTYYFNNNIYAFMNGGLIFLFVYLVIAIFTLFICYLFNVYLIEYNRTSEDNRVKDD